MLKVAVIGIGSISEIHIHALQQMEDVALVGLCDSNPARGLCYPELPFFDSVQRLIDEARPDVVHLCLPHYLHYPIAKQAVEAGIHVFTEKPPALNLSQAMEFARLEQQHPELCMGLCLQNRYNHSVRQLLDIVRSGQAGRVTGVKGLVTWHRDLSYYTAAPWRGRMAEAGGGVMMNQSIHTLDLMQLFGGELDSIHGSISRLAGLPVEVEDTACAAIRFRNGAQGFFCATVANDSNSSVELTVTLEGATYRIRKEALWREDAGVEVLVCSDERLPGEKFYYGASHLAAIRDFLQAVQQGGQQYIHLREGIVPMQMIEAIVQSSAQQCPVVLKGRQ